MKKIRLIRLLIFTGLLSTPICLLHAEIPHVGYVYPAGSKRATVFQATIGGQHLEHVNTAWVSGTDVDVKIIKYIPSDAILKKQRKQAAKKKNESTTASQKEKVENKKSTNSTDDENTKKNIKKKKKRKNPKAQPNAQIDEKVVIEISIDGNAVVGEREIRLISPSGISNPLRFHVSDMEEIREKEPNNRKFQVSDLISIPVLINGQIVPGDVDMFRFKALKGRQFVFRAQARSLIPYLADAVPGWFQAVLAIYDEYGNEVAFVDDYQYDPDPILAFEVPHDGEYILEIRDSIYRGREDFVYRLTIDEQDKSLSSVPAFTAIDPELNTKSEKEPNNKLRNAQSVKLPRIIKGNIEQPGDWDVFKFKGKAGQQVVAEVYARRIGSPLDAVLKLTDKNMNRLAMNDDHEDRSAGLVTHHADSYLYYTLPASGTYYLHLGDIQNKGSIDHAYQLRISHPRPDFQVRILPSGITIPRGGTARITAHVIRKDGFDGDVQLGLTDAPTGFSMNGVTVPANQDKIEMTLSAAMEVPTGCVNLHMEGSARIHDKTVSRPAIPADDMMQAFLNRHLVPAKELVVAVVESENLALSHELLSGTTLKIPAGGSAKMRINLARNNNFRGRLSLTLDNAPEGLALEQNNLSIKKKMRRKSVIIIVKADPEKLKPGYRGNFVMKGIRGKKKILCTVPAVPFEIVEN